SPRDADTSSMDHAWRTHILDFDGAAERRTDQEWLLTNGTGAYSASTTPGIPTRRYHGLLVAAAEPPVRRIVALNQVWDRLVLQRNRHDTPVEQTLDLASLQFTTFEGGTCLSPGGCRLLTVFERGASVRWTWRFGDVQVRRELCLHWKRQAITLHYHVRGLDKLKATATLHVAPMLTLRDFHALTREHDPLPFDVAAGDDTLRVRRGEHAVTCRLVGGSFAADPHWWRGVYYAADAERGQGCHEDYFVPGSLAVALTPT